MSLLNANVGTRTPVNDSFAVAQSDIKECPCSSVLEAWNFVRRLPASNGDFCRNLSTEKSKHDNILAVISLFSALLNVVLGYAS